jgi:NADPH2:quinone reductase
MKAMIIKTHGDASLFEETDIEPSPLKPGYVQVRVMATSVNPVDCKIRALGLPLGPELPAVLHGDVAGIVESVGEGVAAFSPGNRVFGCAGGVKGEGGALGELMNCDADLLAAMPQSLDFVQAAALPLVSITSWEGLIDKARIQPGQTVLVHAGTGGVGHVALQVAKAKGAEVFATVSNDTKAAIAQKLGATPVNYRTSPVEAYVAEHTKGVGFDVVYDTVGGDNIPTSWAAARPGGTVISCQSNSTHDMTPIHLKSLTHAGVLMLLPLLTGNGRAHHGEILREVASLVDKGQLSPLIDERIFTLDQAADAHRHWESGAATGKIVIRVQE